MSTTQIPDTVEGMFSAIHEQHMELTEAVKNKELAEVHHHAFAIRDLTKPLPAKATAKQKKQVEATVRSIARLAVALHESGDAGEQTKAVGNLKNTQAVAWAVQCPTGGRQAFPPMAFRCLFQDAQSQDGET